MAQKQNRIPHVLLGIYCAAMLFLLFARREAADTLPYSEQLMMRVNLIPFHTIGRQIRLLFDINRPWLIRHSIINLFGNVILFIPLGIFLPHIFEKLRSFWKVLLTAAGIIVLVELVQVLTLLGRCDIDDLILNLIGVAVGYGINKRILKK